MCRVSARIVLSFVLISLAVSLFVLPAAAVPVAKTVPWVAANPLVPHDTWNGKIITLKGTSSVYGGNIQYHWDFGDGTATVPAVVSSPTLMYALEATHAYTGTPGTVFTARLYLTDTNTGDTASKEYYVAIRDKTQQVEVNVAIDEGLWAIHTAMYRYTSNGVLYGDWRNWMNGYFSLSAVNINAFEVNGHREDGSADNPYTETVARAMHRLLEVLGTANIGSQSNGLGTFHPETGQLTPNGKAIVLSYAGQPNYETGMVIDAIVASGTPNALAPTTPSSPSYIAGRKYVDIVQDLVDWYSYCQYDSNPGGAWRYNCNEWPDNSVAQWGAIGLIAAERNWGTVVLGPGGVVVPQIVKDWNVPWLAYSQDPSGRFGYTDPGYFPWGPYASTPSGMVQMVMDGLGRNNPPPPQTEPSWVLAETYMRNNFCNAGGYSNNIRSYYYGLFSFTKSMLLHNPPITMLHSTTPGVLDIDWYGAEAALGAPCDGVARSLISRQRWDPTYYGMWYGNDADSRQYWFETAWAIIMLNRTLFEAGAPVAVAIATPNPAVTNAPITLDGSASFHQDPTKQIVKWEWDTNNDGTFELTGPIVTTTYAALGTYPVTLRITDNNAPPKTATNTIQVEVKYPPLPPTANAGRSYTFCLNGPARWYLDGSGSVNPDDGQSLPGHPGDFIKEYAWDLNGDQIYGDIYGKTPDVTGYWSAGNHLIGLRVTDNSSASFPPSPDLQSTDTAQVTVNASCTCIGDLTPYAKSRLVQLTWHDPYAGLPNAADHYNIYRSTVSGGPYTKIGTTKSTYSIYLDYAVTNGTTYYYVVRSAAANDWEYCQSNQIQATPRLYPPR